MGRCDIQQIARESNKCTLDTTEQVIIYPKFCLREKAVPNIVHVTQVHMKQFYIIKFWTKLNPYLDLQTEQVDRISSMCVHDEYMLNKLPYTRIIESSCLKGIEYKTQHNAGHNKTLHFNG